MFEDDKMINGSRLARDITEMLLFDVTSGDAKVKLKRVLKMIENYDDAREKLCSHCFYKAEAQHEVD